MHYIIEFLTTIEIVLGFVGVLLCSTAGVLFVRWRRVTSRIASKTFEDEFALPQNLETVFRLHEGEVDAI